MWGTQVHLVPQVCTSEARAASPGCPRLSCLQVLARWLDQQAAAGRRYRRVLYMGDGKGDYCPSILLLHGSRHWHGTAAPAGGTGAAGAAAAAAQPPCGAASNRIFAREEYPDGLPCSLWVMLRNESSNGGGGGGGKEARPGVVAWSRPEQLAALLLRELQLG